MYYCLYHRDSLAVSMYYKEEKKNATMDNTPNPPSFNDSASNRKYTKMFYWIFIIKLNVPDF